MAYRIKWTSRVTGNVFYSGVGEDRQLKEAWLSQRRTPSVDGEIEEVPPDSSEPDTGYVQDMLSTLSPDELAELIKRFEGKES
jgi:hypothetical protein